MSDYTSTPAPWRCNGGSVYKDDEPIADAWEFGVHDKEANAEHIVKCVNYHDRMVEALEGCQIDMHRFGMVTDQQMDEINDLLSELSSHNGEGGE